MKLLTFQSKDLVQLGVLQDDTIIVLPSEHFPSSMLQFIQASPDALKKAAEYVESAKTVKVNASAVKILAPIANPGKVVAIGLNYKDHCREQNLPLSERPIVFTKFNTSIIGPGDAITWDPALTTGVDYEVELGVVIGKRAKRVSVEHALDAVYGYTIINDVSARDLQFSDKQWVRGKSLDTFCPIGPTIVTADEIPDPQALRLACSVNGVTLQDSTTSEMIFSVAELISILSYSFTFEPGDLIATGTPAGVGWFRNPRIFLKHGDHLTLEVEKIGRLENDVVLG